MGHERAALDAPAGGGRGAPQALVLRERPLRRRGGARLRVRAASSDDEDRRQPPVRFAQLGGGRHGRQSERERADDPRDPAGAPGGRPAAARATREAARAVFSQAGTSVDASAELRESLLRDERELPRTVAHLAEHYPHEAGEPLRRKLAFVAARLELTLAQTPRGAARGARLRWPRRADRGLGGDPREPRVADRRARANRPARLAGPHLRLPLGHARGARQRAEASRGLPGGLARLCRG